MEDANVSAGRVVDLYADGRLVAKAAVVLAGPVPYIEVENTNWAYPGLRLAALDSAGVVTGFEVLDAGLWYVTPPRIHCRPI